MCETARTGQNEIMNHNGSTKWFDHGIDIMVDRSGMQHDKRTSVLQTKEMAKYNDSREVNVAKAKDTDSREVAVAYDNKDGQTKKSQQSKRNGKTHVAQE